MAWPRWLDRWLHHESPVGVDVPPPLEEIGPGDALFDARQRRQVIRLAERHGEVVLQRARETMPDGQAFVDTIRAAKPRTQRARDD